MGDFEKKFPASACRKKKIACSTNVIESLWEKKGKNILPTRLLEKKVLMIRNHPPYPSRVKWSAPYSFVTFPSRIFGDSSSIFGPWTPSILRLANQIEERLSAVFEFCSRQNTTRNNFLYPKNWEWRTFPLSISKTMFDLLLDVIWRLLESKYRSWKDRKFK